MTTGRFDNKDTPTAIALLAADVNVVKGTTREIKEQLVKFIEKSDEKFDGFNSRLVREETDSKNMKEDIGLAHKRIDKISDNINKSISIHEKGCPSREITIQRLAHVSRPPKDTPREIKRINSSNGMVIPTIPKRLYWTAIMIGVAIAAFCVVYLRFGGSFGE